uniref:Lufaxin n=1 Tax=Sergentomyia schwetzi TaxID=114605 RepID=A0A6B9VLH1_9DIPT|nr:lufaxin [Sergentomyia schwetzi]
MKFLLTLIFCLEVCGLITAEKSFHKYWIGKYDKNDKEIHDVTISDCKNSFLDNCHFDKSAFIASFKTPKDHCISAIAVTPTCETNKKKLGSIRCLNGGIARNYCHLIFEFIAKPRKINVKIYGTKPCTLKDRHLGSHPGSTDAFGLPYNFEPGYETTSLQSSLPVYMRWEEKKDIFQYKDGLINKQMKDLHKGDLYHGSTELLNEKDDTYFTFDFPNDLAKKINFIDVFWYQKSRDAEPNIPFIYWEDKSCKSTGDNCTLVFDSDEIITYVLIKIFTGPSRDGSSIDNTYARRNNETEKAAQINQTSEKFQTPKRVKLSAKHPLF